MAPIDDEENLRIELRGGIAHVWHRRPARSEEEADLVLRAIDREIRRSGVHNLMFDSRDAERAADEVQERIWHWLSNHDVIRKVAVLMHAKDRERAVRLAGAERGVRLRTFGDPDAARRWLLEA